MNGAVIKQEEPRWRVFVSHTAELRKYPAVGQSYIDAVERAIISSGHVPVDMIDFTAADAPPAQVCIDRVKGCDVFIGILSTCYGSSVRDNPGVSYTELEYETARESGIPLLVFVVDTASSTLGIPPNALIDLEHGTRQVEFRARIPGTAPRFKDPGDLKYKVLQALQEETTRQRISKAISDVQQSGAKPPMRASKFINRPPVTAPAWFQDRVPETELVVGWLSDPSVRMITVIGRGGIGKTALVCRLLKGLEEGYVPDVADDRAAIPVGGIIYLSPSGNHRATYPNLINDLCRLLRPESAQHIQALYQDPHISPKHVTLAVLESLPVEDGPVIVLLDNLESIMDASAEGLVEDALDEALETVLRAPAHPVKILATTRIPPTTLLRAGPDSHEPLRLEKGLSPVHARMVLRAIDPDGALGLRGSSDEVLDKLQEHTRGYPRALIAVKSILFNNPELTPVDLLTRTQNLPEDEIVEALVGQAYRSLDAPAQQVMQALAVYPTPVAAVGVDFLLQPYDSTVNTAPVMARLVKSQLVRHDARQYYLHPVDRDYVRAQIPREASEGPTLSYTLRALQARAADYYSQVRTPPESWRSLDDVRPILAEFELRCDGDDYDGAAAVLGEIDFDYLQTWGHYSTLLQLHSRLEGHLTDPSEQAIHLSNFGHCQYSVGNYLKAIELHSRALDINNREIGDRAGEAATLGNLGICQYSLGNYPEAIELHSRALDINNREIGDRAGDAATQGNLGICQYSLGNYPEAIELHTRALDIDREIGDRGGEAATLANLGICQSALGDCPRAIELHTQALAINREIGNRAGEATNLANLGNCQFALGDCPRAIELHTQALAINREIGTRANEAANVANLGSCQSGLGNYPEAIELQNRALALNREISNPYDEALILGVMAQARTRTDQLQDAGDLFEEAMELGKTRGFNMTVVECRAGAALVKIRLGNPVAALSLINQAREFSYPSPFPQLWLLEGMAYLALKQPDQARLAFREAEVETGALLTLASENVDALSLRVLACCGLVVTGEALGAGMALGTLSKLRTTIRNAAGVLTDVLTQFSVLAAQDAADALAPLKKALFEEEWR
ncbi:MAG: hypothetical protein JWO93_3360 [Micrococcaceae bacterium]|nr:hypothetical protein [Micrococcaceae bacterium]